MSRVVAVAILGLALACSPATEGDRAVPLLDRFEPGMVESPPVVLEAPARSEWRFESDDDSWRAVGGIEGLRLEQGRLVGRVTSARPVIELAADAPLGGGDRLWAVEVRARVGGGTRLSLTALGTGARATGDLVERRPARPWPLSTPLERGTLTTYRLRVANAFGEGDPLDTTAVERVLLTPSDEAGSEFEIDSVRLIFRDEHLATVEPGVGWHGLGEVFHQALVSRAPERVRFRVRLPARPWLDLAVGTIDAAPVGFRVGVAEADGAEAETVLHRTVTRAERWEPARVALDRWAGRTVDLLLETEAEAPGAVGLWGVATVRSSGAGAEPDAPVQAIVVFIADSLRRDHLPFHGYARDTAPRLADLAAAGVVFADAHSQATWTKVSMPSILSSTYPTSNGVVEFEDRLPSSAVTLAEALRAAGYATFATSSVAFAGQQSNLHQGVEELHERGSFDTPEGEPASKTAREFTDRLLAWMERHRDVPFLAVLHCLDPHTPYRPMAPYDRLWATPEGEADFAAAVEKVRPLIESPLMRRFGMATREELVRAGVDPEAYVAHELDWYDGSIRALDVEVGRVAARLEELGLRDRSLLVFLSDHGEEFLDHGRHWHGNNTYAESTGIPLLMWSPGRLPAGVRVAAPVEAMDLMPTVLELAGVEIPPSVDGRSLLPLLREGRGRAARPAFSERRVQRARRGAPGELDSFALITAEWKLIRTIDPATGAPRHELYDRSRDPLDLHDVAAEHPDVVAELSPQLDRRLEWARARALPSDAAEARSLDAADLERLRSLGYLN